MNHFITTGGKKNPSNMNRGGKGGLENLKSPFVVFIVVTFKIKQPFQ